MNDHDHHDHQVSHLVSLSPEMPPPTSPVQGLTIHFIPIEDFQAPTLNQIEKFLEICDDALEAGKGVAVMLPENIFKIFSKKKRCGRPLQRR